jgi:hypothetical protein
MTTQPNPEETRLVESYKAEWASLVSLAVQWRSGKQIDIAAIAKAAKKNSESVAAKLAAISSAIEDGATREQIIDRGEQDTLKAKAAKRAAAADGRVAMNFRVPADLKECILTDFQKIRSAMGYTTMENCWDWLHSLLLDLSEEEIRHLAGQ